MRLALQGSIECMKDVARYFIYSKFRYFESIPGQIEKAILLYRKSGSTGRALELCFQHKLFDCLSELILHEKTNTSLLEKCGNLFMENQLYEKAVIAYFNSGNIQKGIKICQEYKVVPNESVLENVGSIESDLIQIAQLCMNQGLYLLACKKYIQSGQKMAAMQALLRSGDKDRIIHFASNF